MIDSNQKNNLLYKTTIIAEAGVNHNGDIELAKDMISAAYESGADYIKFQTFKADTLVTTDAQCAEYQIKNTGNKESQYEMLKKLEMSEAMHQILLESSQKKGIEFLSTPFDSESIDYLKSLNLKIGKIPSGEITNLPYLRKIANSFPKLLISTGMASLEEVKRAHFELTKAGANKENITVLHCNTDYPTKMTDVNLLAMVQIKNELNSKVGYSDHTLGIEVPVAAVALGAEVIEKHFTLNRSMKGPDHKASLEPHELKSMVESIRNIEIAVSGSGIKSPSKSELKNINIARKSIVAKTPITEGEFFSTDNLTTKRPGNGISPMCWDNVIGSMAKKNYDIGELIEF